MIPPGERQGTRSRAGRPRKTKAVHSFFQDDSLGSDLFDNETPFAEDELSTLDEFEAFSKKSNTDKPVSTPPDSTIAPRRKKIKRRRQIDPATCERDYSTDELEFMNALSEYKRASGRMFPTCSEILEVLKELGYEKKMESEKSTENVL